MEFEVVLAKGACGFGIYFTSGDDGAAVVDPTTPFYRLPDDELAPGEASGVIAPGDRLRAINTTSVARWRFPDVVDELRRTPLGDAVLRFQRVTTDNDNTDADAMPPLERVDDDNGDPTERKRVRWRLFDWPAANVADNTDARTPHSDAMTRAAAMEQLLVDTETRVRELEAAVEREKKCRFLAEKKNILYRNALAAFSDENAQLRHALDVETRALDRTQSFQRMLQLSI